MILWKRYKSYFKDVAICQHEKILEFFKICVKWLSLAKLHGKIVMLK